MQGEIEMPKHRTVEFVFDERRKAHARSVIEYYARMMSPVLQEINGRLDRGDFTDEEIDELLVALDDYVQALEYASRVCGEFEE